MTDLTQQEIDDRRLVMNIFSGGKPVRNEPAYIRTLIDGHMACLANAEMPTSWSRGTEPQLCQAPMCAEHPHYTMALRFSGEAFCPLALQAEWAWLNHGTTWVKPPHFRVVQRTPEITHRMFVDGPLNGREHRYKWLRSGVKETKARDEDYFKQTVEVHHVFAHRLDSGMAIAAVDPLPRTMYGVYILNTETNNYDWRPEVLNVDDTREMRRGVRSPARRRHAHHRGRS